MRKTALLLLIAMTASLAACGSDVPSSDTTASSADTTGQITSEPADALDARKLVDDELPEKDYGGATFTVLGESSKKKYLNVEDVTGDIVNDAVYARDLAVEERFNVKLDYYLTEQYQDLSTQIKTTVNAGDDAFQLVSGHVVGLGAMALDNYLLNWCDLDYVDFEKPWWSKATTENLTYNDVCILAVGNYALSSIYQSYCVYFNKRLADEYQIPDPYQTVMDGKWTIDHLIGLTKDIYTDVNNNGADDEKDFYGFITAANSQINAYLWAFDNPIIAKDEDGKLSVVYKSNKINDIVEKLVTMIDDNPGITHAGTVSGDTYTLFVEDPTSTLFKNGQAVFVTGGIGGAISAFRDMTDDFGILPLPKWDENQAEYHTMADGSHSVLCVPVTVSDTEMSGIISEALNAETYKQVVPAYYDTALKVKGARDEMSVTVLDMVTSGCVFDMGYVYDAWKGASFIMQRMVRASNTNLESYWAANSAAILDRYAEVIEFFENYGE